MDFTSPLTKDIEGNLSLQGIPLVGNGLPALVAKADVVAAQAALGTITVFTPPVDGDYLILVNLLVTVATTHAFNVAVTYTDEGGTARTFNLNFTLVGSGSLTNSIANANGAVPYLGVAQIIRALAGTPITVSTSGTFTTVTYNVRARVYQVD